MLSATLYRFRKDLAKKPWIILIVFFAIAYMVFMVASSAIETDDVIRNTDLVIGSINIILIVMLNFIFFNGLSNGVVGFSFADVNFHMAGPFSEKFNLFIAATGVAKLCSIMLWVLCSQTSILHMSLGLAPVDVIALLLSASVVLIIGYLLGAFFCARFNNDKKKLKMVKTVAIAINVIFVGLTFISLYKSCGSLEGIKLLGVKGILATAGRTLWAKIFPIAGWVNLIYGGIVVKNSIYILVGIITTVMAFVGLVMLFVKCDVDYYETAIASAQKVADAREAKRAGIDSDTVKLNAKVKVGNESLNAGWGASAFFHRHLFENKRATKLFFVNQLSLLYRLITVFYMAILSNVDNDGPSMGIISGFAMMIILNSIIFGGGKTVLEFNRPYIFMVPEKASRKLFNCILSELPEMIFDSILCAAIMWYFAKLDILACAGVALMMVVFDLLFELMALIALRLFKGLGRVLLTMFRTFMGYGIVLAAVVPGIIVYFITKSMFFMTLTAAGIGIVILAILFTVSRNLIDRVELA